MPELIIIRGLPGSGKSTLAKKFIDFKHVEADMYFITNSGEYRFNPESLKDAHEWCKSRVSYYLRNNFNVVVSNTFSQKWEMEPYLKMEAKITVVECQGAFDNVHGVSIEKILRMKNRWEAYP